MATLQKTASSFLLGGLAAICLLLVALSTQRAIAAPMGLHCKTESFLAPFVFNHSSNLSRQASSVDNYTDIRLFGPRLFRGVSIMTERCYVIEQVLNYTLEEVLRPNSDRFKPHLSEVVSFLDKNRDKINQCHIESENQHIQENLQDLKDTVRMLGESGEIKAIGELYLLFGCLVDACIGSQQTSCWK